ncbi:MAG TPA: hypothetical protein VFA90_00675 [Terriglobales bacterium]|nr:hypothetical protein [Terriglobales bacterium]
MADLSQQIDKKLKEAEAQKQRQHEEESLDKTIEDSFPASDPPSSIPDPDDDSENAA